MALYMLSTEIVTLLIRGESRTLDARIASVPPEELCISAITRGELLLGVSRQELQAMGNEPTAGLQANEEMLPGEVREAIEAAGKAEAPASRPDPATMESLRHATHAVLANLTPREAKALRMRFGIVGIESSTGHTLEKVSKQFEETRERLRSRERSHDLSKLVDQFLSRVSCLPWDATAATHFASIAIELHRVGTPMGTTDTMVAGHAIAVGAILVTASEHRISRLGRLKIENWTRRRATQ